MRLDFESDLLEHARRFATVECEKLPLGLTGDEVITVMRERAQNNRRLLVETNRIIDQHLTPVFENPHSLTDAEADAYADLADKLFTLTTHLDTGLAYPIHKALLARARAAGDVDRILRHLYYCGLINLRWSQNLFASVAEEYFAEAATYIDQYFEITSRDTRMFFNRCLGNHYVSISSMRSVNDDYTLFFQAVDRAVAFWNDARVRALDPDFPWEGFINNSHQNISAWLDRLRSTLFDDRYLAARVYESVQALYGAENQFIPADPINWPDARTVYIISASKYHMGLISAREMTHNMATLFDNTRDDDYSQEGMYRTMQVPCYMLEYMRKWPGVPAAKLHAEEKRVCDRIYQYCKNLPPDADRFLVNRSLANIMPSMLSRYNIDESMEFMLGITTFCHMPTHVHSIMVSKLVQAIARYFLQCKPELFIGVRYTDTAAQVQKRQDEILAEVGLAGLAHDAGKFIFMQTISLCSRRLMGVEFDIIREHVGAGYDMINGCMMQDDCIAHVIRGHHKWYDGKGGYPASFDNTTSPFRFVIDITSVADSIDAATDSIGRSYTSQLTLEEVIGEIQAQAGTRYAPEVAEALEDPALVAELRDIIGTRRSQVYYEVYKAMEARGDAGGQAAQA